MNVLITGGCGYTGSALTNKLVDQDHNVTVVDTQWFGNYLNEKSNLQVIKADIREIEKIPLKNIETIIHLANIANDPGVELNPTLSWEVNVLATHQLADKASRANVKQIIYASSGSVYGVKSEPKVTEDLELVPISAYNKTKMVAERVLLSYKNQMQIHCIRPATVCGISPRMRFDVSVNLLTLQALTNNTMTVFGGAQVRPNIHIDDIVNVYFHFLKNPKIESGCYNAGFENISIKEIAEMIQKATGANIELSESNDPRSYRQDSTKLLSTGFKATKNVQIAISEIIEAYKSGVIEDKDQWHTVKWMNQLGLGK
jgi:nucleoside-diphosphate-sugar epimerase